MMAEQTLRGCTLLDRKLTKGEFKKWLEFGGDAVALETDKGTLRLLKVPQTEQFDYLYSQSPYFKASIIRACAFTFCGLYSRLDQTVYCGGETLRSLVDGWENDPALGEEGLADELQGSVRTTIDRIASYIAVGLSEQQLTDEKEAKDLAYFKENQISDSTVRCLFKNKRTEDIQFHSEYEVGKLSDEELLSYLADRQGFAARTAAEYAEKNQQRIMKKLLEAKIVQDAYSQLLADSSNPLHRMKRISDAVTESGAKTVTVTIQKDGQEATFRTSASSLKGYRQKYWGSEIAASDRREYERLFGRYADYSAEDVVKITYGRQTIFEEDSPAMEQSACDGPVMGGMA